MKKRLFPGLLGIILSGLLFSPGYGQTAKQIMEKMLEAQGGRKVLEKIKDTISSGSVELYAYGMTGSLTLYSKEPNKLRVDVEAMGMIFTQAYDGEKAWMTNMQTGGSEDMPEDMAADFKREALGNDATLNPEKYGISFSYKGKEKIEEKEYLVLEQVYNDGYKAAIYVDQLTYLTYKIRAKTKTDTGEEVDGETYFSDYQKVGEILVAYTRMSYQDGNEYMKITINEIKFNTGLQDSWFKMSQ